jgi:hypothetical protein
VEFVNVALQLLVLQPGLHLARVNLNLDLLGAQPPYGFPNRRLEILAPDQSQVELDRLGENAVAPEEDRRRIRAPFDFEIRESEDTREEVRFRLVHSEEDLGDFF